MNITQAASCSQQGECHRGPGRCMGILSTVLANTGYVAIDMSAAVTTSYAAEECVHYPPLDAVRFHADKSVLAHGVPFARY